MVNLPYSTGRSIISSASLGLAITVGFTAVADAAISCVPPPALSNPITYQGKCPGEAGFPQQMKVNGRDVYIKLPTNKTCSKSLTITYARNIRITGGQFVYNDSKQAVISIGMSSGTTMIDGVLIDVNKKAADAIRTYRHKGRLIVQNVYARGIGGKPSGPHGDLVQPQGGGPLQELTLQNVSGLTGYQGLFTPYRPVEGHGTHKLRLDRVNVGYDPTFPKSSGAGKPLMLLFMGSAGDPVNKVPDKGTTLSSVYVDGSYWNFAYQKAIYAHPRTGSGNCATFDSNQKISGQACGGKPGDFAPASKVGRNYNRAYFCK
ncbi:MAG: hypothetical protein JNM75_05675 [Rhodospirillales bacterium]|nr:hypothetical protein [Rhodospirillales bacterium]